MKPPFVHRRRILFGDCDPGGIVYTPRISHFVVEAGLDFLSDVLGGPAERTMFERGIAPPARKLVVEFRKPMTWDDELEVQVRTREVTERSFSLALRGIVEGDTTFTAELTLVCISKETFRPVEIPEDLKRELAARVGDGTSPSPAGP